MNSKIARLVIGASVISGVAMTVLGQNRPYDQTIGKSCKGCHDSHRESMPNKSFRIKP